mmetsp:Transcript_24747/g.47458  ORF Transcript_24747/g.47458 Transcript_24747/m.47458 type:complete len:256 (+) Transcript_24747:428-1195(+)
MSDQFIKSFVENQLADFVALLLSTEHTVEIPARLVTVVLPGSNVASATAWVLSNEENVVDLAPQGLNLCLQWPFAHPSGLEKRFHGDSWRHVFPEMLICWRGELIHDFFVNEISELINCCVCGRLLFAILLPVAHNLLTFAPSQVHSLDNERVNAFQTQHTECVLECLNVPVILVGSVIHLCGRNFEVLCQLLQQNLILNLDHIRMHEPLHVILHHLFVAFETSNLVCLVKYWAQLEVLRALQKIIVVRCLVSAS